MSDRAGRVRDAALAALAYAGLTIAMTWPLARGIARDVPGDFGDPLLNAWIVAWDSGHILRALGGHPAVLAEYWNANIFHPHPLALAYSEHLTAQALQVFPLYALTQNPILCYNVAFLATFVLSGLGMYLLARELTGRRAVAFVAGLAFAFAPYRFGAAPHLQVISSQWMPFALFGFRRFFDTGRVRPLWGGVAAWLMQNLSCGYYLLYFSPIAAAYIAWEMTVRQRWSDRRTLLPLAAAAAAVLLVTAAFAYPYFEIRQLGFAPRSVFEVDHYSADVYAYLTADENLRVSGWLQAFPKAEGALFPGFAVMLLAFVALGVAGRQARRTVAVAPRHPRVAFVLRWVVVAAVAVAIAMLFGWTLHAKLGPLSMRVTDFNRVLVIGTAAGLALLAASPSARRTSVRWLRSPIGVFALLTLFSIIMSFGPHIDSRGRTIEEHNLYEAFYLWVPGFDGLRVPARFAMIVALGLSILAAFGLAAVERAASTGRSGFRAPRTAVVGTAAIAILLEGLAVPLPINGYSPEYKQAGLTPLPPFVGTGRKIPPVYGYVASRLPPTASIVELPFGEVAFDVRYQFYSTAHWRRLVNGYSGGAPADYGLLSEALKDVLTRPDRAWSTLVQFHPSHAIVHETSYEADRGHRISDWLRAHGAVELDYFYGDRIFELPLP